MSIDFQHIRAVMPAASKSNSLFDASYSDFTNSLFQAFDRKETSRDKEKNSFYQLMANHSNSAVMQGLLSLGNGSVLTQYLQQTTDSTDLTGYPLNPQQQKNETTQLFSSFLQSNVQAKITSSMHSAKTKLQQQLDEFRASYNSHNEFEKMKLQKMEQNISILEQFMQPQKSEHKPLSTEDQLMQLLNQNAAYNKFLFNTTR